MISQIRFFFKVLGYLIFFFAIENKAKLKKARKNTTNGRLRGVSLMKKTAVELKGIKKINKSMNLVFL
ncbi:hypothetical protein GCM10022393_06520 [Aquimarina addita]|uniref:Uncharacterized protein n=1 Tax=Aquimarina addita TaxID=870485 RepID=A0ABP7XD66_9FLAO